LPVTFEPLAKRHDRSHFRCGEAELDEWFQKRAGQDERRNVARVFVALDDASQIVGFYSLSAFTLSLDEVPDDIAAKLPRYDHIPAALIGRLARHEQSRGKGIGEILIADALQRIINVAHDLAVFAIVVEAKNDNASDFYQSFGFIPFPMHPDRLFMLTSMAAAALAQTNGSDGSA
jgi:GNAT superfamily N-acetyltransferase